MPVVQNRITAAAIVAIAIAFAASLPAAAVTAAATPTAASAPAAPSAKQLAALCDGCVIVTSLKSEKRKGKASGVGAVGGAVAGGVVGNKAGDGGGIATGAGAVLGGVLGNEIEKQFKRHRVWITTVTAKDGKVQKFERDADPGFKLGQTVRVQDGKLVALAADKK